MFPKLFSFKFSLNKNNESFKLNDNWLASIKLSLFTTLFWLFNSSSSFLFSSFAFFIILSVWFREVVWFSFKIEIFWFMLLELLFKEFFKLSISSTISAFLSTVSLELKREVPKNSLTTPNDFEKICLLLFNSFMPFSLKK